MPEATIYEDRDPRARKDYVGFAAKPWKQPLMHAVPKSERVEPSSDLALDVGISFFLTPHARTNDSVRGWRRG